LNSRFCSKLNEDVAVINKRPLKNTKAETGLGTADRLVLSSFPDSFRFNEDVF